MGSFPTRLYELIMIPPLPFQFLFLFNMLNVYVKFEEEEITLFWLIDILYCTYMVF